MSEPDGGKKRKGQGGRGGGGESGDKGNKKAKYYAVRSSLGPRTSRPAAARPLTMLRRNCPSGRLVHSGLAVVRCNSVVLHIRANLSRLLLASFKGQTAKPLRSSCYTHRLRHLPLAPSAADRPLHTRLPGHYTHGCQATAQ